MVYRSYALGSLITTRRWTVPLFRAASKKTFYGYLFERFEGYIDQQVRVDEAQVRAAFDSYPEEFASPLHLEVAEMVFTSESIAERVAEASPTRGFLLRSSCRNTVPRLKVSGGRGISGNLPVTEFGAIASGPA